MHQHAHPPSIVSFNSLDVAYQGMTLQHYNALHLSRDPTLRGDRLCGYGWWEHGTVYELITQHYYTWSNLHDHCEYHNSTCANRWRGHKHCRYGWWKQVRTLPFMSSCKSSTEPYFTAGPSTTIPNLLPVLEPHQLQQWLLLICTGRGEGVATVSFLLLAYLLQ